MAQTKFSGPVVSTAGFIGPIVVTAVDDAPIGASTPSTGAFTTVVADAVDATAIGGATPGTGAFTTLSTTGAATLASATVGGDSVYRYEKATLAVTAVASTALTATVPAGAIVTRVITDTTVAFTGTGVTLAVGTAASGEQIVAAANIKAQGIVVHTLAATVKVAAGTVHLTVAQSGTPTAVGGATTYIEYIV